MWISSCLTFWKISLFVCLYPLQRRSSINALHPLRLFYSHLCVPWLISFSANFITITQMILHTGVSKNAFQMRSFLTSKCVYPQCLETGLFIWHSKSDQLTGWVQMVQSYEPCKWYQITFSLLKAANKTVSVRFGLHGRCESHCVHMARAALVCACWKDPLIGPKPGHFLLSGCWQHQQCSGELPVSSFHSP